MYIQPIVAQVDSNMRKQCPLDPPFDQYFSRASQSPISSNSSSMLCCSLAAMVINILLIHWNTWVTWGMNNVQTFAKALVVLDLKPFLHQTKAYTDARTNASSLVPGNILYCDWAQFTKPSKWMVIGGHNLSQDQYFGMQCYLCLRQHLMLMFVAFGMKLRLYFTYGSLYVSADCLMLSMHYCDSVYFALWITIHTFT